MPGWKVQNAPKNLSALHQLVVLFLAFVAVLLLLSGCEQPSPAPSPTLSSTVTEVPADTPAPPAPTATPMPTDTPIPPTPTATPMPTDTPIPPTVSPPPPVDLTTPTLALLEKIGEFAWVAYTPTQYDPDAGKMPTSQDIRDDLDVLYQAGFRGIVTYGASDVLAEIPTLARQAGFEGIIMGIWAPGDPVETQAAIEAAPHVDGYVVGNEGIFSDRYDLETLQQAIADLRGKVEKPVTTSEELSQYETVEGLLAVGDWIFPNVHPYWHNITEPTEAVAWTQRTFDDLVARSNGVPVALKEVGLPTAGMSQASQYQQAEYYVRLRETPVRFVYFEAFDQPWKSEGGVGPHWGLFAQDRAPKVAGNYIVKGKPPFYIYADADAPYNHFFPEGWMGCTSCTDMDANDSSGPLAGTSAIRITYTSIPGQGWAGIYWWHPPSNNWCQVQGGFDLRGWTQLTFWARGERGGEKVKFGVGGIAPCDSLTEAKTTEDLTLTADWTQYTIFLKGANLSNVVGGFMWVTVEDKDATIYLDEIRFE